MHQAYPSLYLILLRLTRHPNTNMCAPTPRILGCIGVQRPHWTSASCVNRIGHCFRPKQFSGVFKGPRDYDRHVFE